MVEKSLFLYLTRLEFYGSVLNMKQKKAKDMCGVNFTAQKLGTTRGKIEYLIKIKKISPGLVPIYAVYGLLFTSEDQKIIKDWTNRKKAK